MSKNTARTLAMTNDVRRPSRRQQQYAKGETKRDRALDLAQRLMILQDDSRFCDFREDLDAAIRRVRFQGRRTEKSDRDRVLAALELGCATIDEFVEDTGLARADVQTVLDYFLEVELIEMRTKGGETDVARGVRQRLYFLRHVPAGSAFSVNHTRSYLEAAEFIA